MMWDMYGICYGICSLLFRMVKITLSLFLMWNCGALTWGGGRFLSAPKNWYYPKSTEVVVLVLIQLAHTDYWLDTGARQQHPTL